MELKVLEESKTKLHLEIQGLGHGFCNILKQELWNDEHIKISAYSLKHPLVGHPMLIVETDTKKSPRDAIEDAIKRLQKTNEKTSKEFDKAFK
ncbi:DNA-directed RNA polymerase subunit L [Candidatus Woesearchaeota archaeon]|nr:DNA-directed RNA polymerase subunit L [Candidatus Woesearchaeota archaeon]